MRERVLAKEKQERLGPKVISTEGLRFVGMCAACRGSAMFAREPCLHCVLGTQLVGCLPPIGCVVHGTPDLGQCARVDPLPCPECWIAEDRPGRGYVRERVRLMDCPVAGCMRCDDVDVRVIFLEDGIEVVRGFQVRPLTWFRLEGSALLSFGVGLYWIEVGLG